MSSLLKKRPSSSSSLFTAIDRLETDDAKAAKQRRKITSSSVAKSKAARSQNDLFTDLMEARILIQRAVCAPLPAPGNNKDDHKDKNDDDDTARLETACRVLFQTMSRARNKLCLLPQHQDDEHDDDDEQSSREEEQDHHNNESKNNDNDDEQRIQSSYESCREEWKQVLDKRRVDLQVHSGMATSSSKKFRVVDQSFWSQVEATVAHDEILRLANQDKDNDNDTTTTKTTNTSSTNRLLFRDDKLYQHQLKDFIRATSAGNHRDDGTTVKNWKMSNNNNKKAVDRKASKGRKIRYTVHPKLTNFCFPMDREMPMIDEDVWFQSLLGGATKKQKKRKLVA